MFLRANQVTPFEWNGLSISDHTATVELSSSLAIIDVPPGAHHPRAWSDRSDKYYVLIEGDLRFEVEDEASDLGPADVCIILRGDAFEYSNTGTVPARVALFHTPRFDSEAEHFV
jgi:mannose-6-phosphate isomerase-like protein (cupin superfamily)